MKILTCLLLMASMLASADDVVPIASVSSHVNIRMLPDSSSEIVGRLEQGSAATLTESIAGWHEIEIEGGATGFVSADWTSIVATAQAAESDTSAAPADELDRQDDEKDVVAEVSNSVAAEDSATLPAVETQPEPGAERVNMPAAVAAPAAVATMQSMKGAAGFLTKFVSPTEGGKSLVFDDGNNVGIGTTEPKQRLEVNGNIQIHEQNSSVAGLMITQAGGETGYIMHNRASTLTIGAGSIDRITISRDGNVGFGVTRPAHPIELESGAHVTAGGVWTNSSSRQKKENIRPLSSADALATLARLEPVSFNYKNDGAENYLGFIAEDVPELVAMADREGLSAMDIVAVLTKVVQQQGEKIAELEARIDQR